MNRPTGRGWTMKVFEVIKIENVSPFLCINCPNCNATDEHDISKFYNTWQENKRNLKNLTVKTDCCFCGSGIEITICVQAVKKKT